LAYERIEADYLADRIDAPSWMRFEAKLTEQIEAARSQVEQHQRQRQAVQPPSLIGGLLGSSEFGG
jgi:hypothetical protein